MTYNIQRDLTNNSGTMSQIMLTMANGVVPAKAAAFDIMSCQFQRSTGSTAIYFTVDGTTPDANSPLLVGTAVYQFPMRDLSNLSFYSTGTDIVQIWYRL